MCNLISNFQKNFKHWVLIIYLVLGFLIYGPGLTSPFVYDDFHVIANLSEMEAFAKCQNWQRVIAHLSFAINLFLWGKDVVSYHVVNVIIHILNAYIIFLSLIQFAKIRVKEISDHQNKRIIPVSFAAALVFLIHPLATQSVVYICQRYTSLATLFYLISFLSFLHARIDYQKNEKFFLKSHILWYLCSFTFAIMAMLTKEFPVSFPFIILLTEFYWFSHAHEKLLNRFVYLFPLLATIVIIILLYFPSFSLRNLFTVLDDQPLNDVLPHWSQGKIERFQFLYTQIEVIWSIYLKLIILPISQSFHHECLVRESIGDVLMPLIGLVVVALLGGGISYRRTHMIGYAMGWFFITVLPTSSIIPSTQLVAEQRAYLPLIALVFLIWEFGFLKFNRNMLCIILVFYQVILIILTINRIPVWREERTLWEDVIRKYPQSARAYFALGEIQMKIHEFENAIASFTKCVRIQQNYSMGYALLGKSYQLSGRTNDAINQLNKAISVNPDNVICYGYLTEIYECMGMHLPQKVILRKLLDIQPLNATIWYQLGNTFTSLKQWDEAEKCYQKVLQLNPQLD